MEKIKVNLNCSYGKFTPNDNPIELPCDIAEDMIKRKSATKYIGKIHDNNLKAELSRSQADLKIAIDFVDKAVKLGQYKKPDGFEDFKKGLKL